MSTTTATLAPRKRLFAELLEERYTHADESQLDVADWLQDYMDHHPIEAELAEIERTAVAEMQRATDHHSRLRTQLRRLVETTTVPDDDDDADLEVSDEEREASLVAARETRRAEIAALTRRVDEAEAKRDKVASETSATMDAIAVIRSYLASNAKLPTLFQVGQAAVSKWKNTKSSPTPEKWVAVSRYLGLPLAETHRLITFHEMPESVIALQHRLASAAKDNRDLVADLRLLRAELARAERAQRDTNEELVRLRSIATSIEQGDRVGVS